MPVKKKIKKMEKARKNVLKIQEIKIRLNKRQKSKKLNKGEREKKVSENLIRKTRIKIIGIGSGGISIISAIAPTLKGADFVAADTDRRALSAVVSKKAKRFYFGENLTHGLGAGMSAKIGEMAARKDEEKIRKILENQDICILISCLGGGVGSGAARVFAEISKKIGNISIGIFILPFKFEGENKMKLAIDSLQDLKFNLNALIVIPNDNIFKIVDLKSSLKKTFSVINEFLVKNLGGLIETIHSPGLVNIDFADLKTILAGAGKLAYLNTVETKDSARPETIVDQLLLNPLYPYSPHKAESALVNVSGGAGLGMREVEQVGRGISEIIDIRGKVVFGINKNKKERLRVLLLANGCQWEERQQSGGGRKKMFVL